MDDINARIAQHVRELRSQRGFTLDALAERSGVSRSMISLIERGESSPTAAVLDKLAGAFSVTLATLFSEAPQSAPASPLARHAEQAVWKDPASGYLRRNVSPPGFASPIQLVEVVFPPGQRVSFENSARDLEVHQQVWLLEGTIELTVGREVWRLSAGDCLAMRLDGGTVYRNPTRKPARYVVALATVPFNHAKRHP
jgi:transcriptional regulator with XRE-family HTH domain